MSRFTVSEILKKYNKIEIELFLAEVLKKPKEFVFINKDHRLTAAQMAQITRMAKRREKGESIAYILGYKDFMGLRFKVNKDVLIPRPETEWLVERVADSVQRAGGRGRIRVLDLGTGSGAIITSLAKLLSTKHLALSTTFYASDISKDALAVAKQNATKHRAKVKFYQSDLFQNIPGTFDVIVANLPYVPLKMLNRFVLKQDSALFAGLKFEPIFALTDGSKSFQIFRRFFEQVRGHIHSGTVILLEIDPSARKFLIEYQKKYLPGWQIKFYKDFNNLWRYAEVSKMSLRASASERSNLI